MTVEITAVGKDAYETDYLNTGDCMLTRALHRAGLTDWIDIGGVIEQISTGKQWTSEEYKLLSNKVVGMYRTSGKISVPTYPTDPFAPHPIEDITITIDI